MAQPSRSFDNKTIASLLYETAELMKVKGDDPFRIRSYERAAEAIESLGEAIAGLVGDEKKLMAIRGIGKSMAGHLQQLFKDGQLQPHTDLLKKYHPSMLE